MALDCFVLQNSVKDTLAQVLQAEAQLEALTAEKAAAAARTTLLEKYIALREATKDGSDDGRWW